MAKAKIKARFKRLTLRRLVSLFFGKLTLKSSAHSFPYPF